MLIFVMPFNNMGNMNISQNLIAILAVSQNRNNIESWPKYRNTIEYYQTVLPISTPTTSYDCLLILSDFNIHVCCPGKPPVSEF